MVVPSDDALSLNALVITTIPRSAPHARDPDGHSEWIVYEPTTAKILNAPGYPRPTPKPRRPDMFVVKSTPNKGLGIFATCDIGVNELIFSERPLLVHPIALGCPDYYPSGFTQAMKQQIILMNYERLIERAVGRMSPEDQECFKSLANCHAQDGSGPLFGICRTNGFGFGYLADGPDPPPDQETAMSARYSAVCKLGSRINHRYVILCRILKFLPTADFH